MKKKQLLKKRALALAISVAMVFASADTFAVQAEEIGNFTAVESGDVPLDARETETVASETDSDPTDSLGTVEETNTTIDSETTEETDTAEETDYTSDSDAAEEDYTEEADVEAEKDSAESDGTNEENSAIEDADICEKDSSVQEDDSEIAKQSDEAEAQTDENGTVPHIEFYVSDIYYFDATIDVDISNCTDTNREFYILLQNTSEESEPRRIKMERFHEKWYFEDLEAGSTYKMWCEAEDVEQEPLIFNTTSLDELTMDLELRPRMSGAYMRARFSKPIITEYDYGYYYYQYYPIL